MLPTPVEVSPQSGFFIVLLTSFPLVYVGKAAGFYLGGEMTFVLLRAEYDRYTERAYVEFRAPDGDGGDAITTAIFSYKTAERLSKRRIQEEVVRKARHLLKKASLAT
jgi:hypothetical protein